MADSLEADAKQTFTIDFSGSKDSVKTTNIGENNLPEPVKWKRGKKADPIKRYMVLGFDTEYQAHGEVTKEQIKDGNQDIHNDILSYQFSMKIITENEESDADLTAEGIIIPEEGKLLNLASFISFALGSFAEQHPNEIIPENIYLVAHFTRADLPGFSGFANLARSFLSNIRNTFVSLGVYMPLDIQIDDDISCRFKVRIRDTVLLAPANTKKLTDVGEIVGLNKMMLGATTEEDIQIKSHGMKDLRDNNWATFKPYAIRDAEICVRYAEKLMRQNHTLTNQLELPVTLTTFGTQMVLRDWESKKWPLDEVLGKETIKDRKYNVKEGKYTYKIEHPYIAEIYMEEAFVTETYHGGRNEQFMFGICDEGKWRDHDLSSAYTTAMSLIGFPKWSEITSITSFKNLKSTDLAFFSVEFEFPKKIRFPCLPVRCDGGIIFPRKGLSYCAAPEVVLAKELGAKLTIKRAIYVPTDPEKPVFKDFIVDCIQKRAAHPKGTFDNLFWKEVGNSTYGKTAQGLKKKRVYDMRSDDMVSLPESKITQPFFASFITSYTRAVLGEMLNGFSKKVQVFSVTTDGFLSDADDEELAAATSGQIYQSFEVARSVLDTTSSALEVKHEIKQPIGWRTRGSATLKSGDGANNIVLLKGGIKVDQHLDLEQENRFIIDLFLNRYPGQQLDYTIGIGLKDMIHYDADFVSKSITKRLSMEFDWKRLPVSPKDTEISFNSKNYRHLSFKTAPLEDKAEFDDIRGTWDVYARGDNNDKTILKTLDDLEQFQNYRHLKQNTYGKNRGYVSKTDADLKKLKTSLTRAFKQNKAGFTGKSNGKKTSHKLFLSQLGDCGIKATVSDLDNAKRFDFEPHTVGITARVVKAAEKLKKQYYPDLDLTVVFPPEYKNRGKIK